MCAAFECRSQDKCISRAQLCDRVIDCAAGEDESDGCSNPDILTAVSRGVPQNQGKQNYNVASATDGNDSGDGLPIATVAAGAAGGAVILIAVALLIMRRRRGAARSVGGTASTQADPGSAPSNGLHGRALGAGVGAWSTDDYAIGSAAYEGVNYEMMGKAAAAADKHPVYEVVTGVSDLDYETPPAYEREPTVQRRSSGAENARDRVESKTGPNYQNAAASAVRVLDEGVYDAVEEETGYIRVRNESTEVRATVPVYDMAENGVAVNNAPVYDMAENSLAVNNTPVLYDMAENSLAVNNAPVYQYTASVDEYDV